MAATTGLMTVEEFLQLPETGPFYYELRHGELVQVTRAKMKHARAQKRIERLLEQAAGNDFCVAVECAFRPRPEHEFRIADVAAVAMDRWENTDDDDNLRGAPDLVIEILSPSNTIAEMNDKEQLCLENGCREFWVVDPMLRQVKVSTPDGITRTYRSGQEVPLNLFPSGTLAVDAIFNAPVPG